MNNSKHRTKFNMINTSKNGFITINEAIAAALKSGSTLSQANKNRFKLANVNSPYDKLSFGEYKRMVAAKKEGINGSRVKFLQKRYNSPANNGNRKPIAHTVGKLGANRLGMFAKKNRNGNKKPNTPAVGKLKNGFNSFLSKQYTTTKSYNANKNGKNIASQRNRTLANANANQKARRERLAKANRNLLTSRNLYKGGKLGERIAMFEKAF